MQVLKADTEVKVRIGPFVDVGDGFTPQVDITLAGNEAELLKHNGVATVSIAANTWAAVTDCRGWYDLTITAGNTDTEGLLTVVVQDDSDCLPVYAHFMVVNANVYDSLYGTAADDYLQVDLLQMGGVAQSATDLKDFADDGYDPATNKVQGVVLTDTCTTNSDVRGTDNAALASVLGAAVGASISADIADVPTVSEFEARTLPSADYVVVGDTIAGATVVGSVSGNVDGSVGSVTGAVGSVAGNVDGLVTGTVAGVTPSVAGDDMNLAADAITSAKYDESTAFPVSNAMSKAGNTVVYGQCSDDNTAASTTVFRSSDITEATADHYNGRIVIFTDGVLIYQATDITDYELDTGEGKFTVTALTEAPPDDCHFVIV